MFVLERKRPIELLSTIKPLQKKENANVIRHTSQTLKGIKHTKQTMQRNAASLMKKGSIILLFSFLFFDSFCEALRASQFKVILLYLYGFVLCLLGSSSVLNKPF